MPIALRGALLLALWGSLSAIPSGIHAEEPESKVAETVKQAPSITRFGITWHFDREARCGVFVNGDPWVLGPVKVVSVTPAPGPAAKEARTKVEKNRFGDASLQDDNRMRNGSMVLLQASNKQGFDSRARNYSPELSVAFPYTLEPQRSLISTKSVDTFPNPNFLKGHGEKSSSMLETAAVLTCLAEPPPADAFRPCYGGVDKPLYRAGALKRERLLQLKPVASAPPLEEYVGYFSRPWIEYGATWMQQATAPNLNRPNYGREFARVVSMGALHLLLDHSAQEKEPLLIGLVQVGIDLHGMTKIGLNYTADGGHYSGRKFPIVFAGWMLDEPEMLTVADRVNFQEDQQTYYGRSFFGQTALFQMVTHHGPRQPYEEKDPQTWDEMDKRSEGYRVCCNANAWIGEALAARLLGMAPAWKHDAFFDYCDRWMSPEDAEIAKKRPGKNDFQGRAWDGFVTDMWKAYRANGPELKREGPCRKWVWEGAKGQWADNPRPK